MKRKKTWPPWIRRCIWLRPWECDSSSADSPLRLIRFASFVRLRNKLERPFFRQCNWTWLGLGRRGFLSCKWRSYSNLFRTRKSCWKWFVFARRRNCLFWFTRTSLCHSECTSFLDFFTLKKIQILLFFSSKINMLGVQVNRSSE